MDLFEFTNKNSMENKGPLADRMKPVNLDDFIGQEHIVGEGKLLRRLIEIDRISSLIFHGPPGCGKTSLARVIANTTSADFITLNAVTSGVKDIRESVEKARNSLSMYLKRTILFIDEIHRFNKTQQDALLPYVEDGTVILIGATTENPYYEINNALVSRSTVLRLDLLDDDYIERVVVNALKNNEKGLGMLDIDLDDDAMRFLCAKSGGDARRALNALEIASLTTVMKDGKIKITIEDIKNSMQEGGFIFDKSGDSHYDVASAFIKSMRGSDPDAAVHYLARMIEGGEKPEFIARRIMILASEDIGNADPNALNIAVSASLAVERIGMPEARIILSQAVIYMAMAAKSNSSYLAINEALDDVRSGRYGSIPVYLRDGTSNSAASRSEDAYKAKMDEHSYLYPHDFSGGYVKQAYLPKELSEKRYYRPTDNGLEQRISLKLKNIKAQ